MELRAQNLRNDINYGKRGTTASATFVFKQTYHTACGFRNRLGLALANNLARNGRSPSLSKRICIRWWLKHFPHLQLKSQNALYSSKSLKYNLTSAAICCTNLHKGFTMSSPIVAIVKLKEFAHRQYWLRYMETVKRNIKFRQHL
jgi:hypothetical protein